MINRKELNNYFHNVLPAVYGAGEIVMAYITDNKSSSKKKDGSVVTKADWEAEKHITNHLKDVSDFPVVGEEAFSEGIADNIEGHEIFWLVDALDGTRAYVAGKKEFTVNIALIYQGKPALGMIYAPAYDECYYALADAGAYEIIDQNNRDLDQRLMIEQHKSNDLVITTSSIKPLPEMFERRFGHAAYQLKSHILHYSSYKFCLLAKGEADIYPRFGPICEWDTAAGHILVTEAGGQVISVKTGQEIRYGRFQNDFYQEAFLAGKKNITI